MCRVRVLERCTFSDVQSAGVEELVHLLALQNDSYLTSEVRQVVLKVSYR